MTGAKRGAPTGRKRLQNETRVSLSAVQKSNIVKYAETHDINNQADIARWVKETYGKLPSVATICTILKERERWRQVLDSEATSYVKNKTRERNSKVAGLEQALSVWSRQIEGNGGFLTGAVLLEKARAIGAQLDLPPKFNYSGKWLDKFKKVHGLRMFDLHGEAGSADMSGVEIARQQVPELLLELETPLEDVHNMDETTLYYRKVPTRTLARRSRAGQKVAKDRVTIVFTVNATGTVKQSVLVIGTAKRPRSFGKVWNPSDVNAVYKQSEKGWMTGKLFEEYCTTMNMKFGPGPGAGSCEHARQFLEPVAGQ